MVSADSESINKILDEMQDAMDLLPPCTTHHACECFSAAATNGKNYVPRLIAALREALNRAGTEYQLQEPITGDVDKDLKPVDAPWVRKVHKILKGEQ